MVAIIGVVVAIFGCIAAWLVVPESVRWLIQTQPTTAFGEIQPTPSNQEETIATAVYMPTTSGDFTAIPSTLAPTLNLPTATSQSPVPFALLDNPNVLNSVFSWEQGGLDGNFYELTQPNLLTMFAARDSTQWMGTNTAPLILYPIQGDFETRVTVVFNPDQDYQTAGLGVRSTSNRERYLRITKQFVSFEGVGWYGNPGGANISNGEPYSGEMVHLRIERQGVQFKVSYSSDEVSWNQVQTYTVNDMPEQVEIYLVVSSAENDVGTWAQFSNFVVVEK